MNDFSSEAITNEKPLHSHETRSSKPQLDPLPEEGLPTPAPSPPPDGGWKAWMQVFAAHQVMMNTSACTNAFGFFQTYYTTALHVSPSAISWVGGTQAFLIMFLGAFSGRIVDAGFYWYLMVWGLGLQILGIFATSFVSQYWQFLLAQGVCQGIGGGLILVPTMAIVSSYFSKKRALAVCGMSVGSATGGIVFPLIAQQLLGKIGIGGTIRIMGCVFVVNAAIAIAVIRPRNTPRKHGALIEVSAFLDPWYSLFGMGMLLTMLGLYFAYYYITAYAEDILHISPNASLSLLLTINALGVPGRFIPSFISDWYLGPQNTLTITVFLAATLMFIWISIDSISGMWAFAVAYGLVTANIQSLTASSLMSAGRDPAKIGAEIGMIFALLSIGMLCGPPIAGVLIEKNGGHYLYAQIYAGGIIFCGGICFAAARLLCTRQLLKQI